MASNFYFLLIMSYFVVSLAQSSYLPNALSLPVTKDVATLQYLTKIDHGTPLVPTKLVVDLGGPFLWIDCASGFVSSSIRPVPSCSIQCSMVNPKTCDLFPENTIAELATRGELIEDIVAIGSIDSISTVHNFLHSCAPTFLLKGLASGAKGMLGLGRSRIALPSQLATKLGSHRRFTVCLSSSNGSILFGNEPKDISKSLMYTPLITNQDTPQEYFINTKSIRVNGKRLSLNTSLLSVDQQGNGGTKISTVVPYTTLESTIYTIFAKAYMKAALSMNMTRVASVAPFELCFSSTNIKRTAFGSAVVPTIDVSLQSEMVKWRIYGRNSMVTLNDEVMCLGFLDGGLNSRTSVVIGGYQLEDVLLQFDLGTSMLGFSSSLLMSQTTCSNFKFDSMPIDSL